LFGNTIKGTRLGITVNGSGTITGRPLHPDAVIMGGMDEVFGL
jgi:hypothetical protein